MSREQRAIADFSVFLMQWISDSNNNHAVSEAIDQAFKKYNDERESSQRALSEFQLFSETHACVFVEFSKDDFFKLCASLELLKDKKQNSDSVKTLITRILDLKKEYNQSMQIIRESSVQPEACELWRRCDFSKQDIELLSSLLPVDAKSVLLAKIPASLFDAEEGGLQAYIQRSKEIADRASTWVKMTAAAVCSTAINLATSNSAAFFSPPSPGSLKPITFLLSIGSSDGSWEVLSSAFSSRTALNIRIIHEVCEVYFRAKQSNQETKDTDGFMEITGEIRLDDKSARSVYCFSADNPKEVKALQSYAEKMISPLAKPGHALQIYQSLLAINADTQRMQLRLPVARKRKEVWTSDEESPDKGPKASAAASLASPPARPAQNDDDDDVPLSDNRRSQVAFTAKPHQAKTTKF